MTNKGLDCFQGQIVKFTLLVYQKTIFILLKYILGII